MSTREFFAERFKIERPGFEKVIRALPSDQLDYRPDPRNSAAGDIAFFMAMELKWLVDVFDAGEIRRDPKPPERPQSTQEIAAEYERQAAELEKRLATMDEAQWNRDAQMYFGDKLMRTMRAGDVAWMFLFDAIHHRGQLTAYLRPMGGKVPAVYGPSADEMGKV
jgi:uncharacterized damage-inducible protein DinB